ncbi:MAG TPA: BadF/BadG/BcrA/BcrD ATPase family protein [Vicinamibacteria bacterium]
MRTVIGIDAGATKTVGLRADEAGQVVAEARRGGANLRTHGELEVEKVFDDLLEALDPDREAAAICLGIAGVDRPPEERVVGGILRRLGYRQRARVVNDAAIALVAGAPERWGIVVLSGTGSIAYGVDRAGRPARAGGYGYLLADEGSGYWLGHRALRAAVRDSDGRGPHTRLTALVFEALGVTSMAELVPRVYEQGMPNHQVAALAGLVQKAVDQGDALAAGFLEEGGSELGLAARAVALELQLGSEPLPVVLAGGAFKACPGLVEPLTRALQLPAARPARLEAEPARGAVALALDLLA